MSIPSEYCKAPVGVLELAEKQLRNNDDVEQALLELSAKLFGGNPTSVTGDDSAYPLGSVPALEAAIADNGNSISRSLELIRRIRDAL